MSVSNSNDRLRYRVRQSNDNHEYQPTVSHSGVYVMGVYTEEELHEEKWAVVSQFLNGHGEEYVRRWVKPFRRMSVNEI